MKVNLRCKFLSMEVSSNHQLADNVSLDKIKEELFKSLNQTFPSHKAYFKCGKITLRDRDGEIDSDQTLRSRLAQNSSFQAVFEL